MRRICRNGLPEELTKLGFGVSAPDIKLRREIFLGEHERKSVTTFDVRPILHVFNLLELSMSLSRWVSENSGRVLWIGRNETGFLSLDRLIGSRLSEYDRHRSLEEWPGFFFRPIDIQAGYDHMLDAGDQDELEVMIEMMSLIALADWNAKLLSCETRNHIEFREGNITFYSDSAERRRSAMDLAARFGLPAGKS